MIDQSPRIATSPDGPRLGLCCLFREEPIKFSTTTASSLGRMARWESRAKLGRLALSNALSLMSAFRFCVEHGIGCFRITSQILPLKTHPKHGYSLDELADGESIRESFQACGEFARQSGLRVCFHPDQFVVLNSPRPEVVSASLLELEYQAEVAEWVNADVINVHGGGAYGDKPKALAEFARNLSRLSPRMRSRLTVENDDRTYTPSDLLPLCRTEGIPLVYDVHHHRCNPDELTVEEATQNALTTWNREPLFHLSSPIQGWDGPTPQRHHDFIDLKDFPPSWRSMPITIEVEAKAKETAVLALNKELNPPTKVARKPRQKRKQA